jgi:hypothetical protein
MARMLEATGPGRVFRAGLFLPEYPDVYLADSIAEMVVSVMG